MGCRNRIDGGWSGAQAVLDGTRWRGGMWLGDIAIRHVVSISTMLFCAMEIRFGDDTDSMSTCVLLQRP